MILVSTVTPVFRGKEFLFELISALSALKEKWEMNGAPIQLHESIFVDDGSSDGSEAILRSLAEKFPFVKVLSLSRNFGQHPATIAGILHSSGDWIVTLDEDLQHRPELIDVFFETGIQSDYSYDIVYGKSSEGVHSGSWRNLSSNGFKKILSKLTRNPNIKKFSSYRLIRGSVARAASAVAIDQTYFDIALSWFTLRATTAEIPMRDDRAKQSISSTYSFRRLLSHAWRMAQSSQVKFLRVGALLGLLSFVVGFLFAAAVVILKIISPETVGVDGWASIVVILLIIGGLNAFLSGLILENISGLVLQGHGKPKFFVVDRAGDEEIRLWFAAKEKDS